MGSDGKDIITVPSISLADLRNLVTESNSLIATTLINGIINTWRWDSSPLLADDNISIVRPNSIINPALPGRWILSPITDNASVVTQTEAENGSMELIKKWSPLRVAQAINIRIEALRNWVIAYVTDGWVFRPGVFKMPDVLGGLMFQWGQILMPPGQLGGYIVKVTFPIAFPRSFLLEMACPNPGVGGGGLAQTYNVTATSPLPVDNKNYFYIQQTSPTYLADGMYIGWFAIGY